METFERLEIWETLQWFNIFLKKGIKKARVKPEGTSDHRHKKTKLTDK